MKLSKEDILMALDKIAEAFPEMSDPAEEIISGIEEEMEEGEELAGEDELDEDEIPEEGELPEDLIDEDEEGEKKPGLAIAIGVKGPKKKKKKLPADLEDFADDEDEDY